MDRESLFGAVIYSYTRREALADGVLVDVSTMAREAGFRIPVAVTCGLWAEAITPGESAVSMGESQDGRLWDVLWMLSLAVRGIRDRRDTLLFKLYVTLEGQGRSLVTLKAVMGADDDGGPCLTIMWPHED